MLNKTESYGRGGETQINVKDNGYQIDKNQSLQPTV